MLVIVNPYATTVSDRLKNLVVYALRGRYEVHAVDTEARDHATELCREAAREGYDVVVAFGGDGTVNEAANGLVGSDTPLFPLPGGRDQRLLPDARDPDRRRRRHRAPARARARLASAAGRRRHRQRPLLPVLGRGRARRQRRPAASTPIRGSRRGWASGTTPGSGCRRSTAAISCTRRGSRPNSEASASTGVTTIVQNGDPYTYFGDRPVDMGEGATLESGDLAGVVLRRAEPDRHPDDHLARAVAPCARRPPPPRAAFSGLERCTSRRSTTGRCRSRSTATTSARRDEAAFAVRPRAMLVVA